MRKSIVVSSLVILAGCLGQVDPGQHKPITNQQPVNPSGAGGDDMSPAPTVTPPTATADMSTDDAGHCGGMQFTLTRVPPNVMLVLDRSSSMNQKIAVGSQTSKWDDLKGAISSLVTNYDAEMRLGASIFSSDGDCGAGNIDVALGAAHGSQIETQLAASGPNGNTPTATTMDTIINQGLLTDKTRGNFVVLATDGQPNCNDTDVTSRINTLYAANPPVKTFVIGIGADTNTNPTLLNQWADAGHTARTGATHYYQTNSPADLKAAFDAIVGGIASCDFKMMQTAPDPSLINVTEDSAAVPKDAVNGYSFDPGSDTVSLHGAACNKLQGNASTKISVVYGCPPPVNPPPIT